MLVHLLILVMSFLCGSIRSPRSPEILRDELSAWHHYRHQSPLRHTHIECLHDSIKGLSDQLYLSIDGTIKTTGDLNNQREQEDLGNGASFLT